MAIFTLTTGPDTFVGGPGDDTVYATAATLNAGDSLTGGPGTDILALVGSGNFRVDQLATFTGFEKITLDNATSGLPSILTLGNQPIEVDATGYVQINVNSSSDWNGGDVINGDPSHSSVIYFSNSSYPPVTLTYDLTSNTFSNITDVDGLADNITLLINSSDTAGIGSFYSYGVTNDNLVTAGSTLDLSHTTVSGFRVSSTNGVGTTFTVSDLGTAFQIAGGPGHDTLIAQGLTLTANERAEIFITSSIETIVDQSGTYNAPPPAPGIVGLTSGNDTFVAPASGSTVYATAATLNAGDSLTGGPGTDVLALVGSGNFRVDQLATFTGFEKITLDNATSGLPSILTLGNQPIEVDATGYVQINVNSSSDWNGGDVINGDPSHSSVIYFSNSSYPPVTLTYDLTSNTFSNITDVDGLADNITLLINSSDTAGIGSFYSYGVTNDNLVTAGSTLDLSHTTVSGFRVSSTNGVGTTFTVSDLGTAFQIAGGPGHDTLIAQGLTLTANERAEIFITSSIETIVDQSGTYNAPPSGATLAATGASVGGTEGSSTGATAVATFTDANPNATASNFTATINWGDGTSTNGTVVAQSGGGFAVDGTHTYADEGKYTVGVSITDVVAARRAPPAA